jgi:hypothetical protein
MLGLKKCESRSDGRTMFMVCVVDHPKTESLFLDYRLECPKSMSDLPRTRCPDPLEGGQNTPPGHSVRKPKACGKITSGCRLLTRTKRRSICLRFHPVHLTMAADFEFFDLSHGISVEKISRKNRHILFHTKT